MPWPGSFVLFICFYFVSADNLSLDSVSEEQLKL